MQLPKVMEQNQCAAYVAQITWQNWLSGTEHAHEIRNIVLEAKYKHKKLQKLTISRANFKIFLDWPVFSLLAVFYFNNRGSRTKPKIGGKPLGNSKRQVNHQQKIKNRKSSYNTNFLLILDSGNAMGFLSAARRQVEVYMSGTPIFICNAERWNKW